jgi:glutamine amidotransferase
MTESSITLIDYGGSNLRSVQKAFEAVGGCARPSDDPDVVRRAAWLVLPGVGAFGAGMEALRQRGLDEATREAVGRGARLLGICLGMQFLFDESEEMGRHAGLGLLPGRVVRFADDALGPDGRPLKVPHVGWNEIAHDGRHPLLAGVAAGAHAYFVHSYYCQPAGNDCVLAWADYGGPFAAVVSHKVGHAVDRGRGHGRVYGIQFHPEKSHRVGLGILRNFVTMMERRDLAG